MLAGYNGVASMEIPPQRLNGIPFPDASPLRVLVVEDHAECAVSFAMLLQLWGHQVQIAKDGPTALAVVQADKPHVVLLDIGLPGMDGWEVARRIRAIGNQAPLLVAITGFGMEADRRCSQEAGFDHHLVKPMEPDVLYQMLAQPRWWTRSHPHPGRDAGGRTVEAPG
jgi:CheY-like chemotaxis protein